MHRRVHSQFQGRRRPRGAGFTLVEVCVALFVVAVGILPIITLVLAARRLDEQAQMQAVGYQIAWQELEALRSLPATSRPVTAQTSFTIPASIQQTYPTPAFAGTYSVSTVAGMGDYKYSVQQIAVSVTWQNGTGSAAQSSVRVSADKTRGAGY